ncbi:MAG: NADP(H)-dependent aldo-keto reductase [gamma proteobacterium symbiont of Bathyaustriella thionipta]|nr:NADP(H)-dependent aldo-keto reductase [gamma proteobacterium symbiont of Bathyaustriella thionipta]
MLTASLGNSDIQVSRICLGTMTYGEQNTRAEAHEQLDYAISRGINFIDTAELYAIPPRAQTYGKTESIIGHWLARRGRRDDLIIASKMAGPGPDWIPHIRGGHSRFNAAQIKQALNASLQRLQTDYIDLYQLHWPERNANYFGELAYQHKDETDLTPFQETLQALKEQIKQGKIRMIGLSNETPWGVMQFLRIAEEMNLPSVVSIQNPYNLLNRTFEIGLAEIAHREQVGLLAYSPLGFGVLSGKYLHGRQPEGARISRWPDYTRYSSAQAVAATQAYVELAQRHNLDPAQMALAFVNSRPFVTSNIIGATNMQQLRSNIDSMQVSLSPEIIQEIEALQLQHPNPSP